MRGRSAIRPASLSRAALVHGEALVDQRARGRRPARRGRGARRASVHRARRAQRVQVGHAAPAGARSGSPPSSGREISGLEEMCLIRWSPPSSSPDASSWKTVSDGEWPGAVVHAPRAARRTPARRRRRAACVDRALGAPGAERARHRAQRERRRPRGMPWRSMSASAKRVVGLHDLARSAPATAPARRARTTSAPERSARICDQPDVVDVLVGDDDPLEVLDAAAVLGQRRLERGQRRGRVRPGVDQRQRVVLDQVAVDPPDRERRGDGERVDGACRAAHASPELGGGGRARPRARRPAARPSVHAAAAAARDRRS